MLKFPNLRGKDKYETWENYSIIFILIGSIILSIGIGLSSFAQKGIPAILAMLGSFVTFISTIILLIIWYIKSWKSD